MHILFISREMLMNRGGGEINDLNLSAELENLGTKISFAARSPVFKNPDTRIHELGSRNCHAARSPYLYGISNLLPGLAAKATRHLDGVLFEHAVRPLVNRLRPDIIHATDRPTIAGLKKSVDTPLAYNIRGNVNPRYFGLLGRCDAFIAWGETSKSMLAHFPKTPALALTPGVNTDLFKPQAGAGLRKELGLEGKTVILFVGRLMKLKQVDMLIEVFAELANVREDLALLIVGDGPLMPRLKTQARESAARDSVVFAGRVRQKDLPRYYQSSDLFVLPSSIENHPIVLLEAMSTGLPVVASHVGDVPKMVRHGEQGFLFDPQSPQDLKVQIQNGLEMCDDAELGEHNRDLVLKAHSWQSRAEAVYQFYSSLVNP